MTRGDRFLVACVAAAALLTAPLAYAAHGDASAATVRGPLGTTVVRLDRPARLVVAGREGGVVVRVADGRAFVEESPCRDQLCVRTGAAVSGRPAVCAPNGVTVSVGGRADVDAVSR